MAYVITEACIDTKDRSCADVCPVDALHFRVALGARGRVDALVPAG